MVNITEEHQSILAYSKQVLSGEKKLDFSRPVGKGYTERCIETPWVAHLVKDVKILLDIGFTFASPEYLGLLLELKDKYNVQISAVDIIEPQRVKTRYPSEWLNSVLEVKVMIGDIRSIDLPKDHFDAVTCISTIEHVGFDEPSKTLPNSAFERKYDASEVNYIRDHDTNRNVLDNLHKTLKPKGKLLISVPMGKGGAILTRDSLGFYCAQMEYNTESWNEIVGHKGYALEEQRFFRLTDLGWVEVNSSIDLNMKSNGQGCAVCSLIKK